MFSNRKNEYSFESSASYNRIAELNENESSTASGSDSGSDENILHVVTNVYTIPISKPTSGVKITNIDPNESQISKKLNEIKINLGQLNDTQHKTESFGTFHSESKRIEHRAINSNINHFASIIDSKNDNNENNMSKSKFQIKSIVEIYDSQENEQEFQEPTGVFKSSNQINQTITQNQIPIHVVKGKNGH